ncbi:MAG TPA: glycosyltransferase [Gemmatimonadaceae bacterium]
MRIAFLASRFPAASETFVRIQVEELLRRGHDVTVFTFASDGGADPLLAAGLRLVYPAARAGRPGARMAALLRLLSIPSALRAGLPWIVGCKAARRTWRMQLQPFDSPVRDFDVIYAQFGPMGLLGSHLRRVGLLTGKLVTAWMGYDVTREPFTYGPRLYQPLFEDGDLHLACSDYLRRRLLELGAPEARTHVHRLGIDLSQFAFVGPAAVSDGELRVVSVGRFVEKKGFADALRAVAGATRQGARLHYTLIGDGPLRAEFETLVTELDLQDRVEILGWRTSGQIAERLAASHLLLAPSVTARNGDMEGLPVVITEAMAIGLPVLGTRHSGIPELVRDGATGWTVPEHDIASMVNVLCSVCASPAQLPRLGRAASEEVRRQHDIKRLVTVLEERFVRLCGQLEWEVR